MKKALLNNWVVKLVCLALAFALWYLIRENVGQTYARPPAQQHWPQQVPVLP